MTKYIIVVVKKKYYVYPFYKNFMLFLLIVKNVLLILYIFGILFLIISRLNIKKTIYFIFFISYGFLDPSIAYCDGWSEANENEHIISEELKVNSDSDSNSDSNKNYEKVYYVIAISISFIIIYGIYYYLNGSGEGFSFPSSNILNSNPFEESEVKFSEDSLNKKLDFDTTPQSTPEKALDRYTSDVSPEYEKGIRILKDL